MDYVFHVIKKVGFGCLAQLQVEKRIQRKDITGTRKHMEYFPGEIQPVAGYRAFLSPINGLQ